MASFIWSDWWGAWIADMGEYTGPWPILPPSVEAYDLTVANGGDELDFIVCKPNVSDPANPGDSSYTTFVRDAYRYQDDGVGAVYHGRSTGPTGPSSAYHVFVLVYPTDYDPMTMNITIAPELLLPPDYSSIGAGPAAQVIQTLDGWTYSVTSADEWPSTFFVDMGAYTGPWPPQPPPLFTESQANQVRFGFHVPGDYTDPHRLIFFDGITSPLGPIGSKPNGLHIYVLANTPSDDVAPPHPPGFYVPRGYSYKGLCTQERSPGQWATTPSPDAEYDGLVNSRATAASRSYHFASDFPYLGPSPPPNDDMAAKLQELGAELIGTSGQETIFGNLEVYAAKHAGAPFALKGYDEDATISAGQIATSYKAPPVPSSTYSTSLPFITPPTEVRYPSWVPYNADNLFGQAFGYAGSEATFLHWRDEPLDWYNRSSCEFATFRWGFGEPAPTQEFPQYTDLDIPIDAYVWEVDYFAETSANPPPWFSPSAEGMTSIGTITASTDFASGTVDKDTSGLSFSGFINLPADFVIITQPHVWADGSVPAYDPLPLSDDDMNSSTILSPGAVHTWRYRVEIGPTGGNVKAVYHIPDVKYWVLGDLIPSNPKNNLKAGNFTLHAADFW